MEPFASVLDLEAGWRNLEADEISVAETLLRRATMQLVKLLGDNHIEIIPDDEIQAGNLTTVACNMVRRVMDSQGGISNMSQSIGTTSASLTFVNPDGSLFLSKSDREMLGLASKNRYRSIEAHTWADDCEGRRF